ncbi:MAG: sulfatase-like hydrolase/transferase [Candidatus Latescibacterota bacterium]|nr:sulfatase-like hydrolase/transferase [Candidatus Latescibacterota bacterium]
MNLLLISIDSLRLDFVSKTNREIQTPNFDNLTQKFCFYTKLFSPASATRPVHTSLFTGLYPFEHGIFSQSSSTMRSDIPTLFDVAEKSGTEVKAFSEVNTLFSGLPYANNIVDYQPSKIQRALTTESKHKRIVFLHFWGAHTPYGASDLSALGETAELLKSGRDDIVRHRYSRAIERTMENQIAPLIRKIDPSNWAIIIFSDHGESWTWDEPYHGCTLKNSVLRVPLFYHIPHSGNPSPVPPVLSIIDLYPSILNLCQIKNDYDGFGQDFLLPNNSTFLRCAQIHPDPLPNDLKIDVTHNPFDDPEHGRQWALFNEQVKHTCDQDNNLRSTVDIFDETVSNNPKWTNDFFDTKWNELCSASKWSDKPFQKEITSDRDILDKQLRDLGYIE